MEDDEAPVAGLAWLAGYWQRIDDSGVSEEMWMPAAAGTMIGVNRSHNAGETTFFEFLRIETDRSGLVYLASPLGRAPATPFRLVELEGRRAVFENPSHDFPQRIIYHREGGVLYSRIEDLAGKRSRTWYWNAARLPR